MDQIERFAARLRHDRIACGQLAAERAGEPAAPAVARRRELIVRDSAAALRAVGG